MSDVSRETKHEQSAAHQLIEKEHTQDLYSPLTKTLRPITVEYRADGCITKREGS